MMSQGEEGQAALSKGSSRPVQGACPQLPWALCTCLPKEGHGIQWWSWSSGIELLGSFSFAGSVINQLCDLGHMVRGKSFGA